MCKRVCLIVALVFLLSLVLSSAANAAAGSLFGWWKFDEGSGTTAQDASGLGNNGIFGPEGTPKWVAGVMGGAIELDGDDDYIDISAIANDFPKDNTFSVSVWIKTTMTGDGNVIGANDTGSGHDFIFGISGNGTLLVEADSVREYPPVINDGAWHMITYVRDGSTAYAYTDGVLVGTETPSGNPSGQARWSVGQEWDSTPSDEYQGQVDDLRFYRRALSAALVADLFQGIEPTFFRASAPEPGDGAVGVATPLLTWKAGDEAVFHDVYVGTSPDLTAADLVGSKQPFTMHWYLPGLTPGGTYYWRVDEMAADGTIHTGNVWSFVAQDLIAYHPAPADGATDVSTSPTLTWQPGQAVAKHHVYFGSDLDAVTQGAAAVDKGETTETSIEAGELDAATAYYWRVDETAFGNELRPGNVWSFMTVLPVDDFESYTDDEGGRIYETWIDGWTNNTGSVVGNLTAPFAEQTIVYGGLQSMPLEYNNVDPPSYSEAELALSPAKNFTTNGVDTLILYVRGQRSNGEVPLAVTLEDASGKKATVVNPDATIVNKASWTKWSVPLSDFAGVNATRIKTLYITLGDRDNPTPGGAGKLYIDEIGVAKSAPAQ